MEDTPKVRAVIAQIEAARAKANALDNDEQPPPRIVCTTCLSVVTVHHWQQIDPMDHEIWVECSCGHVFGRFAPPFDRAMIKKRDPLVTDIRSYTDDDVHTMFVAAEKRMEDAALAARLYKSVLDRNPSGLK